MQAVLICFDVPTPLPHETQDAGAVDTRTDHADRAGILALQALRSAIELGVFTELAKGPEAFAALGGRLGLHPRSALDFLDTLVALGFLTREGDRYANSPEADLFLDRKNRRTWAASSRWATSCTTGICPPSRC